MPLCVKNEAKLLSALSAANNAKAKLPSIGNLAEGIAQAKSLRIDIRKADKDVKRAESYRTALHWRYGQVLLACKSLCKHGDWGNVLAAIGETYQRADESMMIARKFIKEKDAARVTVRQAIKSARKDGRFYNCYENCFATPKWLRDAITAEYGFPGLDSCSSHNMHFGERWYSPKNDEAGKGAVAFEGLAQSWRKHCPKNKIVWCNSPFHRPVLEKWITKCYRQAQTGLTVVQLVPNWAINDLIVCHAEQRLPAAQVVQDGFGPKAGKAGFRGRGAVDVMVCIWRRGQKIKDTRIHPVVLKKQRICKTAK